PGQGYDSSLASKSIPITLTASTATTGLKTGSLLVHNMALTISGAGHGSGDGDDTISVTGQVVDNRVITASAVTFGRVIAAANVSLATTLSSPGSDDSNTRVTVKGTIGASDSNGVFITAGVDNVFDGTLTSANRNLQGNFATVGSKAGSRSFTVQ